MRDPFTRLRRLAQRRVDAEAAYRAEIVRLVDVEHFSLREVARAAGVTNPAIHYIVSKARNAT